MLNHANQVVILPQPATSRDSVLTTLLGAVQFEVQERLAQSLHRSVDATFLNLGKALDPDQVRSPWAMEISVQESPAQLLPPNMTIAQVFDLPDVAHKLLILGESGSGKTTMLLELAQTWVEKALEDANAPIPVLVDLASWKDPQQPIVDWLVEELKLKYGLRQELGRHFLVQKSLLLFLDGLDEVTPDRQEDCALALNTWLMADMNLQPVGTVICCRQMEYEEIIGKHLVLRNFVALQPLSDGQIESSLTRFPHNKMWETVQASSTLQNLLQKPLFLDVFRLIAPQFDLLEWQRRDTDAERMEYLLDRYWVVAMERSLVDAKSQEQGILSKTYGKEKRPNYKQVRRALVFAAKSIERITD